ncbi:hypothetical protein RND81_01G056800 [Saponaria officinalis]|uniref:CGL160/ATPI domain-containing protein n=1 Tax=Saponaria officinalis TaxID=3572 RepID=A0AAW1NBS1_SAPOF
METLSKSMWLQFNNSPSFHRPKYSNTNSSSINSSAFSQKCFSIHHYSPHILTFRTNERVEDDILREFLQDRHLNGDLITKYSDILFQRRVISFDDAEANKLVDNTRTTEEIVVDEPDGEGGFLKLTKTQEWLQGETSAPTNRKPTNKEIQYDRERRRQLSLLGYEALKSELLFLTLGVGAACTGYCLLAFSIQAAVSYASGVGFSYLYMRLLYQHVDKLSRDSIPLIFRQRKAKKIGIRSDDLQDSIEKTVRGSGIALSSPRLVIPAAIYGLWVLLHQNLANDVFDFQIVPAMMGLFAYKAAALIQVYRDNEDLELVFPDDI